ncbi:MAG TPA: ABC transporter permease [Chloroflexia bacterium]|nr:ABC transporter permease [Chloroflexia bacterium]
MSYRIWNIWRKELIDGLRDRKALTQALLVPLLLGIFYAIFNPWINAMISDRAREPVSIPSLGIENADQRFLDVLKQQDITLTQYEGDLQGSIRRGVESVGLVIPPDFSERIRQELPAGLTLYTNSAAGGIFGGGFSAERLNLAIKTYSEQVTVERVQQRDLDPSLLAPVSLDAQELATPAQLGGIFASFTLPILLATIVAQGGMFLAIDVTAGEKERGTLESVLVTPANDFEVFVGKLAAVFTLTCVPIVLTFMGFYIASNILPASVTQGAVLPFEVVLAAILLSLPLALFFDAALMIVSVRTKAFKDAQQALTPFMFAAIAPAMVAAFATPTNPAFYGIPVYGTAALVGKLATGAPVPEVAFVFAVAGSLVAAAVCVVIGLRLFNRERLLYGV